MTEIVNGRYEVLDTLGQGGYGAVHRAHDKMLDRFVALKQLHSLGFGSNVKERFLEEVRISSQLTHPSALMIYDFGVSEFGDPFLVSELLNGVSLQDYLRDKVCTTAETLGLMIEVAGVLQEAHELGIVHRDLKPANLYVHLPPSRKNVSKTVIQLLDFGIAKVMQQEGGGATKSGAIVGTPAYMAPEQIKDSSKVNSLCDQYSLGLVAWSALQGDRPFRGDNEFELMHKQIHEPLPPLTVQGEGLEVLLKVIDRMTLKESEERYPNMQEVIDELEQLRFEVDGFRTLPSISLEGMISSQESRSKTYTSSRSHSIDFRSLSNQSKVNIDPSTQQKSGLESYMETVDFAGYSPVITIESQSNQLTYEECMDETLLPEDEESLVGHKEGGNETLQDGSTTESISAQAYVPSVDENDLPHQNQINDPKFIIMVAISTVLLIGLVWVMFSSQETSNLSTHKASMGQASPQLGPKKRFKRHRIVFLPRPSPLGYAIGSEVEVLVENRLGHPQDYFEVYSVPKCMQQISDPSRILYRLNEKECGAIIVKVNNEEITTTIHTQNLVDEVLGEVE